MKKVKLGILGAGKISTTVAATLVQLEELEVLAVASRSLTKAEAFAGQFGIPRAYGSYEQMLQDPEIELVYIATPHSHHYAHMLLAISHGKAVICEKAFTLNAAQAREVREAAKNAGVYCAEAIWPRYMPSRKMIDDLLSGGIIGKVNTLTANLSYVIYDKERIIRPELAGGALLDIGVYGLNFALMHFGENIARMESSVQMTETGVDGMETITLFYENGTMAVLTHSIYARSDRKGIIHGEKGYIVVENINNPQSVTVYDLEDRVVETHEIPPQISGYEYEFAEAVRCIREGKTGSEFMPLERSIFLMELMDRIRRGGGMVYPQERE